MDRLIYVLDTNVIIDYLRDIEMIKKQLHSVLEDNHHVYLCQPVYYEVMRGLIRVNSGRKRNIFQQKFSPMLEWVTVTDADWQLAAQFWADAINTMNRQLADNDLLIAAITKRLGGVLVTADDDFDVLPISRENWRIQI